MNVCLIRPPTVLRELSLTVKPSPPLGLAFIAGALRSAGHKVTVIDAIAERPDHFNPFFNDIVTNGLTNEEVLGIIPADTNVIGLTMMFTNNWLNDRKLIDLLGENLPEVSIVAGGEHITGMPERCIRQTKHLKACVLGEGEETIVELVSALENKQDLRSVNGIVYRNGNDIVTNERRSRVKAVEAIPWPAWELFPLEIYRKHGLYYGVAHNEMSLPIMATRGCPYSCTFCSSPQMWGTRYYMRTPEDVANEMEYFIRTLGATNFDFYDLTAIIKKSWIIDFTKEILKRKLNITWQIPAGTRSEAIDEEVAHYLYLSGCKNITYAPESGSPYILKEIKKKVVLQRMLESIKHAHKEKMSVKLNIIIGFPEERHLDLWKTMWFLAKSSWYGVNDSFPALLVPYTGCELFDRLLKEGKINPEQDEYYLRIIDGDTFFSGHYFNDHIPQNFLRTYRLMYLVVFYGTNWLFRPQRLVRTIRNMITGRFETRGEMSLHQIIKRGVSKGSFTKPLVTEGANL